MRGEVQQLAAKQDPQAAELQSKNATWITAYVGEVIRRETGARVTALVADVSSASEARRLVDAAVSEYGGLEIVVHNAGGPPAGETLAMTEEQWHKAFEQNLLSFTRIAGAAAPEMNLALKPATLTFIEAAAATGAIVLIGDPGRSYFPRDRFTQIAEHRVPVTRELEDAEIKRTAVWRLG